MGVWTKKRGSMKAVVLVATPCPKSLRGKGEKWIAVRGCNSRPKSLIQPQSGTRAKPCAMPCAKLALRMVKIGNVDHCQPSLIRFCLTIAPSRHKLLF